MTYETPLLLLGYNRPEQMRGLIQSLAPHKPPLILFAVDGPKNNRPNDPDLVHQTQELTTEITWETKVHTRFRKSNLGLRKAVVDAVSWANSEYGSVIVLEDDIRSGPQLLEFLNHNLIAHKTNPKIAHINGYNLVPKKHLTNPEHASRLSVYPESYAWATWDRAWQKYDDNLTWAKNATIRDIAKVCGSYVGALRWKQNFALADAGLIDTWAYRWLASMWENNWMMVSPNRNIATYHGQIGGTHTRTRGKNIEPTVEILKDIESPNFSNFVDRQAEFWLKRNVFTETKLGLISGALNYLILNLLKLKKYNPKNFA